jgi:4'-phosphopantetheinyl transferase
MEGIIAQHFSMNEKSEILAVQMEDRIKAFYRVWTRKEAVLKAQGEGLLKPLYSIDVAANSSSGAWWLRLVESTFQEKFSFLDIEAPSGYCAAVAVADDLNNFTISRNFFI